MVDSVMATVELNFALSRDGGDLILLMMRALLVHIAWTLCCNRIFVCRRCIMNGQHQSDGTSF